ncbi:hypothetical protein ACN50C_08945 [Levilactobacillus brevis]|uniref:hypothetical protein n=1 Tax=Levilactobacillus brevis TaxID=1580 RepID=UPI003AFAAA77
MNNEQRAHDLTLLILKEKGDSLKSYAKKVGAEPSLLDSYKVIYGETLKWVEKQNF